MPSMPENSSRRPTGRPIPRRRPPRSWLPTWNPSRCFPDRRTFCVPLGPIVGRRRRSRYSSLIENSSSFGKKTRCSRRNPPKRCWRPFRPCGWVPGPGIVDPVAAVPCWKSASRSTGVSSRGGEAPVNGSVPSSRFLLRTFVPCRASFAGR
jgi:hypothetical protein